jgi:hypothetical protein
MGIRFSSRHHRSASATLTDLFKEIMGIKALAL